MPAPSARLNQALDSTVPQYTFGLGKLEFLRRVFPSSYTRLRLKEKLQLPESNSNGP
jgi:hypothetical protein